MKKHFLFLLSTLVAESAVAQHDPGQGPADPKAPVPRTEYRSAFADYRPAVEEKLRPWRESNEAVKEAHGHAAHGAKPPEQEKPAAKSEEHGGDK